MSDLLSQLEAATEGSAELEGRMWCEANGKIFIRAYEMDHFRPSWVQCEYRDKPRGRREVTRDGDILRWTRDLQDAVSLVPEGKRWSVDSDGIAVVGDINEVRQNSHASSACLALCIAIIKAHESKDRPVKLPEIRRIAEADDGALEGDL